MGAKNMKEGIFLYITKWVYFSKWKKGITFTITGSNDSIGYYAIETPLISTSKIDELYLTNEKLSESIDVFKKMLYQKLDETKNRLPETVWAHPIGLVFNEEWRMVARAYFGGAPIKERAYLEGVDEVRLKTPLSPEEIVFFSMLLNEVVFVK